MSVVVPADAVKNLLSNQSFATVIEQRNKDEDTCSADLLLERTIYSGWLPNRGYETIFKNV